MAYLPCHLLKQFEHELPQKLMFEADDNVSYAFKNSHLRCAPRTQGLWLQLVQGIKLKGRGSFVIYP